MKVQSIELKHFKRFRDKKFDFTDPDTGAAKDLVVLIGKNGSGKSTILQTIAATLGTATRQLEKPGDMDWPGFNLELADKSWQLPGKASIEVEFSDDEIKSVIEFFEKVPGLKSRQDVAPPGKSSNIKISLEKGDVNIGKRASERFQFMGREYAKQIYRFHPDGANIFKRVGGVFWYTEVRNAISLFPFIGENEPPTLSLMRAKLIDLFYYHERLIRNAAEPLPGQRDLYASLEKAYQYIFPNRNFEGTTPQTEIGQIFGESRFYLYDGKKQYEFSEMSGGERAIFPLIFDFANWEIHNSVILIDEIELHLHPPMQQGLLRALKHLGQNNQFIITTHSDAVESIVPEDAIIRLKEGE